jgi:hypothetical protein
MDCVLDQLQNKLRELSKLSLDYTPDYFPVVLNGFQVELRGYGHSTLSLAVHKETIPVEFGLEQATFMLFLGEQVCPKILSMDNAGYVMEYLRPARVSYDSLWNQELFLELYVWGRSLEDIPYAKQIGDESWRGELEKSIGVTVPDWALDTTCLIHGDPTLDNTLENKNGSIIVTDPIPPHRLIRPSIKAIDHGKILQSLLGWEVVLRGISCVEYEWPKFMQDYDTARRAVFWAMVALKRIALRNNTSNAGQWAERMAKELESCI